ncbi:hypothetical protein [Klebsiella aerogenes]|uniref:hypothetical protein n=2 Tax=Klebsiella aerogenes TaxID=548 RepID=UPI002A824662|nr:hypothetical protein [Klebsiella aerogenes]WPS00501.1 hypothetical protein SM790_09195 [Klebsiella aerogenes]WPS39832.1 hypothetical protein SM910_09445 [Klebsiella aerogenes]
MNNEIEFKFGDYAIIEQKRHGVPNEMFVHKVIDQLRSNTWVDVPVQSPATETLHDEMEDVCWCICCGVSETEVRKYRVKDMQRSNLSPDGGEVTALALTLEKSREASGCPAGVDLQDWVKQLAAENVALKSNLMFWDADNPELPYDSPEEIASECSLNYNEEFVVQVAAKLPNRTYRVCESWESDCKLELVEGADLKTPATDRIVAGIKADGVALAKSAFEKHIQSTSCYQDEMVGMESALSIACQVESQLREGADK